MGSRHGSEVEPSHESIARLLRGGPEAVPGETLVVVEEHRQDVALDLAARRRATAGYEVHHVGVTVELDEIIDVVLGELSQHQALGLQKDLHPIILSASDPFAKRHALWPTPAAPSGAAGMGSVRE